MSSSDTRMAAPPADQLASLIWQRTERLGASLWEPDQILDPDSLPAMVLFLIGSGDGGPEIILTRRSHLVRQPGDLCCPGGGVMPRLDPWLARMLRLPGSPLRRWTHWSSLKKHRPKAAKTLGLALATALREGLEEMRLWPMGVRMLMPLPSQSLNMFKRKILPIACWVTAQRRFFPNWEVAKVVRLPIARLMALDGHAMLHLKLVDDAGAEAGASQFPCFQFATDSDTDILWGATYRITMDFMRLVLDYQPPGPKGLPVVEITRGPAYIAGNNRTRT